MAQPAVQPIPQNEPDPATKEAQAVLSLHNSATEARTRTPARWNPPTQRSKTAGEQSGRKVRK